MRLRDLRKLVEQAGGGSVAAVTVQALGTTPVANSFNDREMIVSVPVKAGSFYVASFQVASAVGATPGTQLSYGLEAPTSESPANWQSNLMTIEDDGSGVDHQWSTSQVIHILTDGFLGVGAYTIGSPDFDLSLPGDPGDASLTGIKLVVKQV